MPPLNSWQTIPVPPPTLPSATGPPVAVSSAARRWSGRTWKPLMSLSRPSYVSPTTGRAHHVAGDSARSTSAATRASRTTPTLWVLVIAIGVVSFPDSRTHSRPVSSPLPLSRWQPAKTGSFQSSGPRATTTVTPVRTGPRADDERSVAIDDRCMSHADARDIRDGIEWSRAAEPDGDAEVTRPHRWMLAVAGASATLVSLGAQAARPTGAARRPHGPDGAGCDSFDFVLRIRTISRRAV